MKAENQAALSKPLLIGLLREAGLDWLYVGKVLLAIFMGEIGRASCRERV